MDFTFGIIQDNAPVFVDQIIDSIEKEKIPKYEVIVVGGELKKQREDTIHVPFDLITKSGKPWITRKKNLITNMAQYENIVYMNDYIKLEEGWYKGQLEADGDFDVRMDRIINFNGERYRDWCLWCKNHIFIDKLIRTACLLPYDITHLTRYQVIFGLYWVSKKEFMKKYPLDEGLGWAEGEDVVWSKQIRNFAKIKMNVKSATKLLKLKDRVFTEPNEVVVKALKEIK